MSASGEQLAIIRRPRLGGTDRGLVGLSFETYITESSAASQWLMMENDPEGLSRALDLLRTVSDVSDLNGKPCWVDTSRNGLIVYLRPAKIA